MKAINQIDFLLLFISLFGNHQVSGLGQCETLGPDSCLTAYPDCIVVPIRACCYGVGSVCVSSTYTSIIDNGNTTITGQPNCLKNIITNQVYQLDYEISQLPGYEISTPNNMTCATMNCEGLGLYRWQTSRGICDMPCPDGFVCKSIRGSAQCVPTTCKDLKCDSQSECIHMVELGMAACFLKIDKNDVIPSCMTSPCPTGFVCQKGEFSDFDCIPETGDLFQEDYNCSSCPKDFICDQFGWGIMCTEWSFSEGPPLQCYESNCLFAQFCNHDTKRCEFHRCSDNPDLCAKDMVCVQFDVTQPRVCASRSVVPYTDTPLWLQKFPFLNNRDSFTD
ncbi:hypothetical protein PPL_07705 [Heterostelium album PN500]|uniref:DSCP-N domain-containing protein n=1 Tax=Heterostelium pallidum (strain ATCC 26659 / Pp 5 / PN500) TaxID=670386 RepID=D3BGQ3_HETP5|nr:hypothetical protein PPL_07705 [Heterostelium album PN500]EFA79287.1 hypothetical protein PPL_07705 [Heterostelium album PN500]|eukprot:XP_020431408.1 hypothetical protein PPL_07705 [Heterostelium album PN500]